MTDSEQKSMIGLDQPPEPGDSSRRIWWRLLCVSVLMVTLVVGVVGFLCYRCYRVAFIFDEVGMYDSEINVLYEPPAWVWNILGRYANGLCRIDEIKYLRVESKHISLVSELDCRSLSFDYTPLTAEGALSLAQCESLRELSLFYQEPRLMLEERQAISKHAMDALVQSTTIEELSIYFADLPVNALVLCTRLQTLRKLCLAGSNIEEPDFRELATLPNLTELELEGELTDQDLWEIGHLPHLERLSVGTTEFSDQAIHEFRKLHPDCKIQSGMEFSIYSPWDD